MTSRDLVVLGSTGSIGTQALDIVSRNPKRFRVIALTAGGANTQLLAEQAVAFDVSRIGIADEASIDPFCEAFDKEAARANSDRKSSQLEMIVGESASTEIAATKTDVVLNAMTGSIGLQPTLAALETDAILALANKESLVVGGPIVKRAAREGQIVPVDSEHSALAQAMRSGTHDEIRRLVLTASGGPFRNATQAELANVTPEQALAHPTWDMGPVVTINSATLVNKGLEVIEAHLLFDVPYEQIDVVVHPQSIVHSMVEFVDGSTIAQASPPDMRMPISLALGWPDRIAQAAPACDWTSATSWEFQPLNNELFPAVGVARTVGAAAGTAPAVFNAANEECVAAFLNGTIRFIDIVPTVSAVVLNHLASGELTGPEHSYVPNERVTLQDVLAAETWARAEARRLSGGE